MAKAELRFDIIDAVKQKRTVNANKEPNPADDEWKCFSYFFGGGLVLAASLWDLYYRSFRFCGALFILDVIELVDIIVRVMLVVVSMVQFVEYWVVETPKPVEMDMLAWLFWGLSLLSCVVYCCEHLYGRYVRDAPASGDNIEDTLPLQIVNREKFSSVGVAVVVTCIYAFVTVCVVMVLLVHLTTLQTRVSAVALASVALFIAADFLYTTARLSRFKEIVNQGWENANIAGFHTFVSMCMVLPVGLVLCVHSA
jgi:hypothetical protein